MILYRLAKEKFAHSLQASGAANRWNLQHQFVLYTSTSLSLCALELLAHTGGIRPLGNFKVMTIETDNDLSVESLETTQLPEHWNNLGTYYHTQNIGSTWYSSSSYLALEVPSAIIPQEKNILLNTIHINFKDKVKLKSIDDFFWDERFPQ